MKLLVSLGMYTQQWTARSCNRTICKLVGWLVSWFDLVSCLVGLGLVGLVGWLVGYIGLVSWLVIDQLV